MVGYTKLFGSLLASTVWREDDKVRILWITLLAMADKHGVAHGSVPGIADLARISLEDCERALARLQEPDRYSRSQDHQGRRIVAVEGGFRLLNHGRYRALMSAEDRKEYQRQWLARKRRQVVDSAIDKSTVSTQAEAEAEADKNPPNPPYRGARKPTRAERQTAERLIQNAFGCTHEPRCASHDACVVLVVQGLRERTQ